MSERIGEVISTTSLDFTAQRLVAEEARTPGPVQPPDLGSLVWVRLPEGGRVFAVVSYGTTEGLDRGRLAVVRTHGDVVDERVYHEHPQLANVLRTEFTAVLVGYEQDGRMFHHLPPQPPPLHYAVYAASAEEVRAFSDDLRYLRLLLNTSSPVPGEQLLAAHVRELYRARGHDREWLAHAARAIANLLKRDYERLRAAIDALEGVGGSND